MLVCAYCGIRQYAGVSYVEEPRCVECDTPLGRPKSAFLDRKESPDELAYEAGRRAPDDG
jgi:hypothetical protein